MNVNLENIISDLAGDFAKAAASKSLKIGGQAYKKAEVLLETCFLKYLSRSYERHSKIKTLLYRDKPVDLASHYVTTDFQITNEEPIGGSSMFTELESHKRNVITGTAGSGKSMFLRWQFIELINSGSGKIPILIELRLLNDSDSVTKVLDYMLSEMKSINESFDLSQLKYALKLGKLAIFLDGFDEIDHKHRKLYEKEILEISNKYGNNTIVVSSRPDDCFSSWTEFYVFEALPLSQEQAISLIEKIEYEETTKDKFITEIRNGLYDTHSDFLSNPLLLTMMLLTYEQLAEIPEKIHIFYEQAFDTLFHKHDALKSLYKRKTYTSLPIDDFKKIFSAFCLITFSERKLSFSYAEIIKKIGEAIDIEGFDVKREDFFNDLVKSVCIIQKDGSVYTFSHRSFQEYFAAVFISSSQSIDTGQVIEELLENHPRDNSVNLLFELNQELVERNWLAPRLEKIVSLGAKPIARNDWLGYLAIFFSGFHVFKIHIRSRPKAKKLADKDVDLHVSYFPKSDSGYMHAMYFCFEKYECVFRELNLETFSIHDSEKSREDRGAAHNRDARLLLEQYDLKYSDVMGPRELPFEQINNDGLWMEQTLIVSFCDDTYEAVCRVHEHLEEKHKVRKSALSKILKKSKR